MTVRYDRNATFLGVPMTRVRNFLRRWQYRNLRYIGKLKDVDLDFRAVSVVADELTRQGMVGAVGDGLTDCLQHGATEKGVALMRASPLSPLPRSRADNLVRDLLARCSLVNARDDLPIKVERVWLFGSYVHGEESVNDIDLVVETTGTVMWDDHRACLTAAIALGGGSWLSQSMANLPQEYITRRVIYGPRKDPRLAPTSLGDLCALACECRLAFDAGRGGEVDDPVLPRHPESKGRSRYAGGKRTMPSLLEDLPPEPILPFHLECADSYTFASDAAFAGYFASLSYVEGVQALRRLGDVGFIVEPVYLGYKARPSELLGWLEKCGPLDGRSRAVAWLGDGSGKPLVALLISRSMERSQSGGWAYVVDVLDVYAPRRKLPDVDIVALGSAMLGLAGGDCERIARHARANGQTVDLQVLVGNTSAVGIGDRVGEYLGRAFDLTSRGEVSWLSDYANAAFSDVASKLLSENDGAGITPLSPGRW